MQKYSVPPRLLSLFQTSTLIDIWLEQSQVMAGTTNADHEKCFESEFNFRRET